MENPYVVNLKHDNLDKEFADNPVRAKWLKGIIALQMAKFQTGEIDSYADIVRICTSECKNALELYAVSYSLGIAITQMKRVADGEIKNLLDDL